jgi:hypothetical protein
MSSNDGRDQWRSMAINDDSYNFAVYFMLNPCIKKVVAVKDIDDELAEKGLR